MTKNIPLTRFSNAVSRSPYCCEVHYTTRSNRVRLEEERTCIPPLYKETEKGKKKTLTHRGLWNYCVNLINEMNIIIYIMGVGIVFLELLFASQNTILYFMLYLRLYYE